MNKEQAKQLIKDTFETSFDRSIFIIFIKDLLNRIDESKARHFRGYVKQAFKQVAKVIKTYERIGTYTDPSGKKIDVLVVYLEKKVSLDRARTTMRNFVAKYLKNRGEKNAALVAYVSPDEEDWRFSLVKMDYRFEEAKTGRVKIKEEFTPARRWSFLVGKNERSHTARSRFVPILKDDENNPTLIELEEAFNIERVSKEFFEKYRALFMRTVNELDKIVKKDKKVRENFELKNINAVDFAKKLLGQIVFLYFLQKKGWFGVKRDADWGTGPKHFLRKLFEKNHSDYKNFFNDILEPLFYEALARERDDNFYSRFNCKIPFLNGGLFESIGGYDWVHTDINLPNELFSNSYKTEEGDIGNGILDVLDRFNFTVKEDEPLEKEVAIDPELLGKLYEKFNAIRHDNFYEYKKALASGKKTLEKKFNRQHGVYYTPREIVHYMCQQSLINYLHSALNQELMKEPARTPRQTKLIGSQEPEQLRFHTEKEIVRKQDMEKLIKYGEQFIENELAAIEKIKKIKEGKQKTTTIKPLLPVSVIDNAKVIDEKLKDIRVCDPAVGSGAFPVGMMAEIVKTRNALTTYLGDNSYLSQSDKESHSEFISESRNPYNFKRDCIENSIYGVDIDPGAVEIAKLRLWLSLVVDEEDFKQIKPLPNLDYKIVCGNSLLGVEKNLFNNELFIQLEKLKPLYFNETNPTKKRQYKNQINKLISKITNGQTEFDFEVYFSEVFHQNGGFDVVIANPPYVRQEKIKDQKESLKRQGYDVYNSTSDLYTYFYERSWKILKPNGFSCFISSNKWMRAKYGENLRRFFKKSTKVFNLVDFGGYPVFEATVDTNIILFQRTLPDKEHQARYMNVRSEIVGDLIDYIEKNQSTIHQHKLSDNAWTLAEEQILKLKEKIKEISKPIRNWNVEIYRGIITGFNKAFIVTTGKRDEILTNCRTIEERRKTEQVIKPMLRGRNIRRYYCRWVELWLIKIESGWTNRNRKNKNPKKCFKEIFPALWNYFISFADKKGKGKGLLNRDDQGDYWWELRDCDYYHEFEKEKIIYPDISDRLSFTYDNKYFLNNTCYFINSGSKYLLSVLNSSVVNFYYRQISSQLGNKAIRAFTVFIEQLSIPSITQQNQHIAKELENLVNKILPLTQSEDYLESPQKQAKVKGYEGRIDELVYKLYGLTEDEIKIVKGEFYE